MRDLQEELEELTSQLASARTQSSLTASQGGNKMRQLEDELGACAPLTPLYGERGI